jgi:hypothetical protein
MKLITLGQNQFLSSLGLPHLYFDKRLHKCYYNQFIIILSP